MPKQCVRPNARSITEPDFAALELFAGFGILLAFIMDIYG
jgi:hypothetical protein